VIDNSFNKLDKKGGNPNGLFIVEMMKLPLWKLRVMMFLLKLHLTIIVKWYLKH